MYHCQSDIWMDRLLMSPVSQIGSYLTNWTGMYVRTYVRMDGSIATLTFNIGASCVAESDTAGATWRLDVFD